MKAHVDYRETQSALLIERYRGRRFETETEIETETETEEAKAESEIEIDMCIRICSLDDLLMGSESRGMGSSSLSLRSKLAEAS